MTELNTPQVRSFFERLPRAYVAAVHHALDSSSFWRWLWGICGTVFFLSIFLNTSLFFAYTRPGAMSAVAGVFNSAIDPFGSHLRKAAGTLSSDTLYQDALPLSLSSWSWEADADWRSIAANHEGPHTLRIRFTAGGGTVGANGSSIDITKRTAVSLWLLPDGRVEDLYLTLYNNSGVSLGTQSLGWYTGGGKLTPGLWQEVRVPLSSFAAPRGGTISGFAISAKEVGMAFADSIKLMNEPVSHAPWVPSTPALILDPFSNATPVPLPYNLSFDGNALGAWHTYVGKFLIEDNMLLAGPSSIQTSTGSLSVIPGGRAWSNYRARVNVEWGDASTLSLLLRASDENSYVSCAFSDQGGFVQMYLVKEGNVTTLGHASRRAKSQDLSAEVRGDKVSCYAGEKEMLDETVVGMEVLGSAGISSWDQSVEAGSHRIHSFSVEAIGGE